MLDGAISGVESNVRSSAQNAGVPRLSDAGAYVQIAVLLRLVYTLYLDLTLGPLGAV